MSDEKSKMDEDMMMLRGRMNYSGIYHFKHHYVKDKFFKTRVTRTLKLNPINKIKIFIKEKNQRNL